MESSTLDEAIANVDAKIADTIALIARPEFDSMLILYCRDLGELRVAREALSNERAYLRYFEHRATPAT